MHGPNMAVLNFLVCLHTAVALTVLLCGIVRLSGHRKITSPFSGTCI